MAKFYEVYKSLILTITLSGVYFTSIEKIYRGKYIKFLKILCILPAICMPIHFGASFKYLLFDAYDERSRIFGCAVTLFSFFVFFTFYSFYYTRHAFERLFELWDSMFQDELFPEHRQELLKKNAKLTIRWLKGFGSIITLSSFGYCMVLYFNPSKKLNHPTGIPYRHQSPDFELVNTLDLIVASFGCSGLIAFDSMTMAFISMEEAQLQHLKTSLAWILDTVSVTESGNVQIKSGVNKIKTKFYKSRMPALREMACSISRLCIKECTDHLKTAGATMEVNDAHSDAYQMTKTFEETREQIKIWITHHQQVLRFHDEFQKVYSVPLSVKFLYFVFIVCLTCFLMLAGELTPLDIAYAIQYFFNNYTIFYVNVIHADTVAETASTIFGDAFEKSWHLYPKELKTLMHIIQMQSNRPLHYLAFKKYSLSSNSFLKMLSSAYSLFTFLIQVNRKKN